MNCPKCSAEMELGAVEIDGPRFAFLFIGLSAPRHLFWVSEKGESEMALRMDELAAAHLCNACGTIVIDPERH